MDERASIGELRELIPRCLLPDQVRLGSRLVALLRDRSGRHRAGPLLERWLAQARRSVAARAARAAIVARVKYPEGLPIVAHREVLVEAIRRHPVIVVAGETGSGKTTQLPKFCLEAGLGVRARIGCTQPRRVAALSIARRLAEELELSAGREVGAKIRFTDNTRAETSIKVMTDGILLAEVQGDPYLSEYEMVILDEAHERSLNLDFLMGHLKHLLEKRDDLKLIVTSATIDTERFSAAFAGAPVFQVSGRMFPVEVRYRPIDEAAQESGETTYVDAAVEAVRELLGGSGRGDILVFLPSERDIQETCARLEPRGDEPWEIVPLYGRLSGGEQQRVFEPKALRRVVVATNIAETSLTVPRIRYVVDTGLARISRYQAGTRCRRLPIEPISQSSANQRQGRCGRLSDGVCIRLYAEDDFATRPVFTPPEIERCNLAEVVLRLKAWPMGEVEEFPFIDPPPAAALRGACQLLKELGALDDELRLTGLGRDLARMPVDPSIGRMLIEAHHEGALSEVLVIAAGLSIQDPRELPADQRDTAKAAHRKFEDRRSDFLGLLNIWNAYHDTWESLSTQSQMRKFCRTHFLSYLRMREWRDVHAQLSDVLADMGGFELNREPADYAAIHRSILTGLWGHIGQRTGRNEYRMAGGRAVSLFPGSTLFDGSARRPKHAAAGPAEAKVSQPEWIVAGETVETSRSFARTVAGIEPGWVIELAPHLCRREYLNPGWDRSVGRVQATERVTLAGLVLRERKVPYATVDAAEATRLFIGQALVPEDFESPPRFLEHNHRLRQKIEIWQTRLPHRLVADLDEAFVQFYAGRLERVSSVSDLNRWLKERGGARVLEAEPAAILGEHAAAFAANEFPDLVVVGDQTVPVSYAYAPGEDHDGITMKLSVPLAAVADPEQLEWAVPALRVERVGQLLRLLPKTLRRPLMPLPAAARAIVEAVPADSKSFLRGMTDFVRRRYGIDVPASAWAREALPAHLCPRFEIVGADPHAPLAGRDLAALVKRLPSAVAEVQAGVWQQAAERWERYSLKAWDFGDLPESHRVGEVAGLPVMGYPGLQCEQGEVHLRLFRTKPEAETATREGWPGLAERVMHRELAWAQKDLRGLTGAKVWYVTLGSGDELTATAWENLRRHLLPPRSGGRLIAGEFEAYLERARGRLPGLAQALIERVTLILQRRQEALMHRRPLSDMKRQIDELVPPRFLEQVPFERLAELPRYLQALVIRADRAALNPAKDTEKWRRVEPFVRALSVGMSAAAGRPEVLSVWRDFRWLIEEFKVSCFAQELGTSVPISAQRLTAALEEMR
ncbi:MAG: ATP-dependent RNA helicase HrpA [Verrucomicrobia bacterium]|nr:ATP-dependent RNA helicase HrpA [Verrucomicrobiota bacterium]